VLIVAFLSLFALLLSRCSAADISLLFPLLSPLFLEHPHRPKGLRFQMLVRHAREPRSQIEISGTAAAWRTDYRAMRLKAHFATRHGIVIIAGHELADQLRPSQLGDLR
jgi:hypothetical protein